MCFSCQKCTWPQVAAASCQALLCMAFLEQRLPPGSYSSSDDAWLHAYVVLGGIASAVCLPDLWCVCSPAADCVSISDPSRLPCRSGDGQVPGP